MGDKFSLVNTKQLLYNFYMNKRKIIYSILAILFGIFIFIYGGYDDSPGAQLIGFVITIIGIVGVIKNKKKT